LFNRAKKFRDSHIKKIDSKEEFYAYFTPKNLENPEIHGGFALSHWGEDAVIEEKIKQDLSVTIRCIPLEGPEEEGKCPFSGKKSHRRVIYAKAY
jgi:prolyl-tRNA synthetase